MICILSQNGRRLLAGWLGGSEASGGPASTTQQPHRLYVCLIVTKMAKSDEVFRRSIEQKSLRLVTPTSCGLADTVDYYRYNTLHQSCCFLTVLLFFELCSSVTTISGCIALWHGKSRERKFILSIQLCSTSTKSTRDNLASSNHWGHPSAFHCSARAPKHVAASYEAVAEGLQVASSKSLDPPGRRALVDRYAIALWPC